MVRAVLFVSTPAALVCRILGIRFLGTGLEHRIGHLVAEPYLAFRVSQQPGTRLKRIYLLYNPAKVVNPDILKYLPRIFVWHQSPTLRLLLRPLQRHPMSTIDMTEGVRTTSKAATIFAAIPQKVTPLFPLLADEPGRAVLERFGLRDVDWFVAVHIRQSSELDQGEMHSYRNATLDSFFEMFDAVRDLGGAIVRLGDRDMDRLPSMPRVVDYAHLRAKPSSMDVRLASSARLFVGSTSGPLALAGVQGTPIVGVNMAPFGAARVWGPKDIFCPKLYFSLEMGRTLTFAEVVGSSSPRLADIRFSEGFARERIALIETPGDEILEATLEGLKIGRYKSTPPPKIRKLQAELDALFDQGNYSFYSKSKASRYFLEKHRQLIESPKP